MAASFPPTLFNFFLICPAFGEHFNHPRTDWRDDVVTAIASLLNALKPGWPWMIQTLGQRSLYRYLVNQHTPATYRYLARYALPAYLQTSHHAHAALKATLVRRYNRLGDLEQVRCPVLVLAGAGDRHITAAASRETADHLPQATYRCYGQVAHLFPWEIPTRVLDDIEQWLDTQT